MTKILVFTAAALGGYLIGYVSPWQFYDALFWAITAPACFLWAFTITSVFKPWRT